MKKMVLRCLWIGILTFGLPYSTDACSCSWGGPFMTVSKEALLVVHGRIVRHNLGQSPTMSVLVLETLKGGLLDSGIIVQMGDGMHCRPVLEEFPMGSEWILALNGPGSKPGRGLALSHCGEYWLRVSNGEVIGSIDGTQSQIKRLVLTEFKRRFLYPRFVERFSGRVSHGKRFYRPFGGRFEFILVPIQQGWEILIKEYGRDENLARLTPPLHFAPNPREIEGWQFLKDPSSCPNVPYQKVAGQDNPRQFIFSPDVGLSIQGQEARMSPTEEDLEKVKRFGKGHLDIKKVALQEEAHCPQIEWMEFSVYLEGGY
ncbi:MAG: hypothetical protein N2376_14585 [Clostridia bacterium]|nr:hypothetical protein [Clostridia bacterium]